MARGIRFCLSFLHVARVKKKAMRDSHVKRVRFSHFLEKMVASQKNTAMRELRVSSRNVQKSVTQMIIPWATAYRALLVRGMKPDWPRAGQQLPSNCGSFSLPAIATVSC